MLYFIRHAESEANVLGLLAGQRDDSILTAKGEQQALEAAKDMIRRGIKIDQIVSSPLLRASLTAEIIAAELGLAKDSIKYDDRAKEYDMGDLTDQLEAEVTPQDRRQSNSEDPSSFQSRALDLVRELKAEPGNNLLVSHAGIGKIIEAAEIGLDPDRYYELPAYPNAQLVELG